MPFSINAKVLVTSGQRDHCNLVSSGFWISEKCTSIGAFCHNWCRMRANQLLKNPMLVLKFRISQEDHGGPSFVALLSEKFGSAVQAQISRYFLLLSD